MLIYACCVFFFFKQKTAYEMRISDWSSDVCSSDLFALFQAGRPRPVHIEIPLDVLVEEADALLATTPVNISRAGAAPSAVAQMSAMLAKAQRARKSVVWGKRV